MSTDSTHSTALRGRRLVADELQARGWAVRETRVGRRPVMLIEWKGMRRQLRVSAKRRGTWQTSTAYGVETASDEQRGRYWIFVDVGVTPPDFFVVPEDWMAEDIHATHQRYLNRHGGSRRDAPKSQHHAIPTERIASWRDRWELLEVSRS